MADFCTLCGYNDIDIQKIYKTYFKNDKLKESIESMKDTEFYSASLGAVCEHCGIVSIAINKKYEVIAGYVDNKTLHIGDVNPDTLELNLFDDLPEYEEQRQFKSRSVKTSSNSPTIRNSIESQLNLSDNEIRAHYNQWLQNDLTNIGLCEILLYQLIKEDISVKGPQYKGEYDRIKLKYSDNLKGLIKQSDVISDAIVIEDTKKDSPVKENTKKIVKEVTTQKDK